MPSILKAPTDRAHPMFKVPRTGYIDPTTKGTVSADLSPFLSDDGRRHHRHSERHQLHRPTQKSKGVFNMPPAALNALVLAIFGARADAATTSALGSIAAFPNTIIGAIQGSPWVGNPVGFNDVRDARNAVDTGRKKSEWTGYHAEMMILNAILGYLNISTAQSHAQIAVALANATGGVSITANAPCCKHCGNMLDALGVAYHGAKGAAGLTGWWNPLTDVVTPNGSPEFARDIPG
jgi:hypothetical protein